MRSSVDNHDNLEPTIGFLGFGKMGQAIFNGILADSKFDNNDFKKDKYYVCDPFIKANNFDKNDNLIFCDNLESLFSKSDVLFLCIKPNNFNDFFKEVKKIFHDRILDVKMVISIAAGIRLKTLTSNLPKEFKVSRVMPNNPALIGKGISAVCFSENFTTDNKNFIILILKSIGEVVSIDEDLFDAVTGLSGSGPAYVYNFISSLAEGGVKMGLSKEVALTLATHTVLGASETLLKTKLSPEELISQVTSPGGTTLSGLEALEKNNFKNTCIEAVRAATNRSIELGKN